MSRERGTGHLLSQRKGGGGELSAYGGSLTLTDAAIKNVHLNHRLDKHNKSTDDEAGRATKKNYRRRLSLRQEILQLQQGKKRVHYLDGDMRHKAPSQWGVTIPMKECVLPAGKKILSKYLPYLVEKDLALCPESGSLPDLTPVGSDDLPLLNTANEYGGVEDDYELLKTGSLDSLDHVEYVLKQRSNNNKGDMSSTVHNSSDYDKKSNSTPLQKYVPLQRSQSSTGIRSDDVKDDVTSTSPPTGANKLNGRRSKRKTLKDHPRMIRRKSKSMSDLRELFPRLNLSEKTDTSFVNSTSQSIEDLVAAVRQRKQGYKHWSENQQSTS